MTTWLEFVIKRITKMIIEYYYYVYRDSPKISRFGIMLGGNAFSEYVVLGLNLLSNPNCQYVCWASTILYTN